ncbi:MBL fold metallo-hydrolase [Aeromicrobium massiliense]|uniref:MBL fold metallo-hydrolase n=1 Tax=Aeromicrobium massiliense TaxID=1464554 RepID=UPI0002F27301|nr:MBL fold metallo-hydrolase [Aeromicrobium massiliense]
MTTVSERAAYVLAPNPGVMTLDGTNTYVLRERDGARSVVVDPGPLDEHHLARVLELAGDVALVLVTHHHADHTEAVPRFAELTGAPTRAVSPEHCVGAEPLADGEVLDVDGLTIQVLHTPGHTADSACFLLPAEDVLLSGDTILGRGTTIVAHPDGRLGPYLDSLRAVQELVVTGHVERILPAHGPVIDDPATVVDFYLTHREERLEQVRQAVAAGAVTPQDVVERVYADVDRALWPAAERSVAAQLEHLRQS